MYQYFLSRSLMTKMLLVFVPLVILTEFLAFGIQAWYSYQNEKAALIEQLEDVLDIKVKSLAYPLWEFDEEEITSNIGQLKKLEYFESIGIYDESGDLIASLGNVDSVPEEEEYRKTREVRFLDADTEITVGKIVLTVHERAIFSDLMQDAKFNAVILVALVMTLAFSVGRRLRAAAPACHISLSRILASSLSRRSL